MIRSSTLRCVTVACALSLGYSFAACAQDAAAPASTRDAAKTEQATTPGSAESEAHDRNCIRDTGSLIRQRTGNGRHACLPVAGRSYSREDLQRTGSASTADALRKLDSSVR